MAMDRSERLDGIAQRSLLGIDGIVHRMRRNAILSNNSFGFRGVTRMRLDILDGILSVSLVIIVLAVIERRRANVGSVETAKSALGQWSGVLETIAKCVVVTFGITFLVAIVLPLYRRG